MLRNFLLILSGVLCGLGLAFLAIDYPPVHNYFYPPQKLVSEQRIIGFLPYWLVSKAQTDYSPYLTDLSYFGLTLATDGSIVKMLNPTEAEPGWHALQSGVLDDSFTSAKSHNVRLSLLLFSGDNDTIGQIIADPAVSATNTLRDVLPVMKAYGFTDLNIDIESIGVASEGARQNFTNYVRLLSHGISHEAQGTVSLDISPDNILRTSLIDLPAIAKSIDTLIIMGYDYHYAGSIVTGAVGPLFGAGTVFEYDTQAAVELAQKTIPAKKIVLGIPLYGYEWETLTSDPRTAVIPGTGLTASNKRVEQLLKNCTECTTGFDLDAKEAYVIYKDPTTGTFHQLYYPDKRATAAKVKYVTDAKLGGLALWALGYEGEDLMEPLKEYKSN